MTIIKECTICNNKYSKTASIARCSNSKTCSIGCRRLLLGKLLKGRKFTALQKTNMSQPKGEKSQNWKGDEIGYRTIHQWIQLQRGKPHYCEHCKKSNLKHRQYQWANKSGEYKRDISDWLRLCAKCHKKYDS